MQAIVMAAHLYKIWDTVGILLIVRDSTPSPLAGAGWDEGGQATEGADRCRVRWEEMRGGGR